MKIAIVGSRDFNNLQLISDYINSLPQDTIIVSGGCRGVDDVAEQYAKRRGLQVIVFLADWQQFGKRAGYIRNIDIVKESDKIVAFWDGKSRGTKHTIDIANKYGKPIEIITGEK